MKISTRALGAIFAVCLFWQPGALFAHHSFAVHFLPDGEVQVTGVVDRFRFANPHGVLEFTVTNEDGEKVAWRAETNSPSLLRRRGWNRDSLKPGQEVTVTGWPARSEEHYMRIRKVTFADGSVLATQRGINLDQD